MMPPKIPKGGMPTKSTADRAKGLIAVLKMRLDGPVHPDRYGMNPDFGGDHTTIRKQTIRDAIGLLESIVDDEDVSADGLSSRERIWALGIGAGIGAFLLAMLLLVKEVVG